MGEGEKIRNNATQRNTSTVGRSDGRTVGQSDSRQGNNYSGQGGDFLFVFFRVHHSFEKIIIGKQLNGRILRKMKRERSTSVIPTTIKRILTLSMFIVFLFLFPSIVEWHFAKRTVLPRRCTFGTRRTSICREPQKLSPQSARKHCLVTSIFNTRDTSPTHCLDFIKEEEFPDSGPFLGS